MAYVLYALLLFCASVMAHVFFCRKTTRPGLQARTYILIAVVMTGVYTAGVYLVEQGGFLDPHSLWGLPFEFTAGTIFVLLVPVYMSFYVLTQLMSPSKKILLTIGRRGGLSYSEIVRCVEEEDLIDTRLNDLLTSGCVRQVEGRYLLSSSGQKISTVLNTMQYVLGRDIGG